MGFRPGGSRGVGGSEYAGFVGRQDAWSATRRVVGRSRRLTTETPLARAVPRPAENPISTDISDRRGDYAQTTGRQIAQTRSSRAKSSVRGGHDRQVDPENCCLTSRQRVSSPTSSWGTKLGRAGRMRLRTEYVTGQRWPDRNCYAVTPGGPARGYVQRFMVVGRGRVGYRVSCKGKGRNRPRDPRGMGRPATDLVASYQPFKPPEENPPGDDAGKCAGAGRRRADHRGQRRRPAAHAPAAEDVGLRRCASRRTARPASRRP